jgi:hypothetical protein
MKKFVLNKYYMCITECDVDCEFTIDYKHLTFGEHHFNPGDVIRICDTQIIKIECDCGCDGSFTSAYAYLGSPYIWCMMVEERDREYFRRM